MAGNEDYNVPNEIERANDLIKEAEGRSRILLAEARKTGDIEKQNKLEALLKKVLEDDKLFTGNFEYGKYIIDEYPGILRDL
jgi:hypothetical protein